MESEGPQFFLLRLGDSYIVTEAVLSVRDEALPASVREAIGKEFDKALETGKLQGVKLPEPNDARAIFKLFQSYKTTTAGDR